ncbi:MAG: hypothetical protein Q9191_005817 [Dirinaria sp. TL-2023a]
MSAIEIATASIILKGANFPRLIAVAVGEAAGIPAVPAAADAGAGGAGAVGAAETAEGNDEDDADENESDDEKQQTDNTDDNALNEEDSDSLGLISEAANLTCVDANPSAADPSTTYNSSFDDYDEIDQY